MIKELILQQQLNGHTETEYVFHWKVEFEKIKQNITDFSRKRKDQYDSCYDLSLVNTLHFHFMSGISLK